MLINRPDSDYDIVIAGAGLVGGSFALLLAQQAAAADLKILILDAMPLAVNADDVADFDARSTALSWGSRLIFERAGLWPELAEFGCPIKDIHVSDRGHFGAVRLHSHELQVEALGYVLENRHLASVINQALLRHTGIQICAPAEVQQINPVANGCCITVNLPDADPVTINTTLLVLADGGRSGLCEQLGITLKRRPYGQQALICNIAFDTPHDGLAYERFTDTGPMALLPLPAERQAGYAHRGALVWTLADDEAQAVRQLPDDLFLAALQKRFGWRQGKFIKAGARSLYPLALTLANEQIRPGIVLLGNVAHTLHPVAGQGLNLALRDAEALAGFLASEVKAGSGGQLGAYAVLERYAKSQAADQYSTVMFSDLTTRLFSTDKQLVAAGRNVGLLLMDLIPPARQWFARQAMGLR